MLEDYFFPEISWEKQIWDAYNKDARRLLVRQQKEQRDWYLLLLRCKRHYCYTLRESVMHVCIVCVCVYVVSLRDKIEVLCSSVIIVHKYMKNGMWSYTCYFIFANHPSVLPAWESINRGLHCFRAERGDHFPFRKPTFGGLSLNLNIEKVTFERHFMQDSQRTVWDSTLHIWSARVLANLKL